MTYHTKSKNRGSAGMKLSQFSFILFNLSHYGVAPTWLVYRACRVYRDLVPVLLREYYCRYDSDIKAMPTLFALCHDCTF